MKKLTLILALIVGGCGGGSDLNEDFFQKYYGECIHLCEACQRLQEMCNLPPRYDVNECTMEMWRNGRSPHDCDLRMDDMQKKYFDPNNCAEYDKDPVWVRIACFPNDQE